MTDTPMIVAHHGTTVALNFDYAALREAVAKWKGGESYKKAAERAGIDAMSLHRIINGKLIAYPTVQKLCAAMRRDPAEFVK